MKDQERKKVFLGGTCNGSTWRDKLIPMLHTDIPYFNPVVEDWTEDCQVIEESEKWGPCNIHLYVITPDMKGTYSIAELVESAICSYEYNEELQEAVSYTIFAVLEESLDTGKTFTKAEIKSFDAIKKLVEKYGGIICDDLNDVADTINSLA